MPLVAAVFRVVDDWPRPTGQTLRMRTRLEVLFVAIAWTVVGASLGMSAAIAGGVGYALLPVAWAMTIHGARTLQVQLVHQAAHRTLFDSRLANLVFGHLISGLLIIEEFSRYRDSHFRLHHHPARLSTTVDPTVQYLLSLGIEPGVSRSRLWARLATNLLSPIFHMRRIVARISSHFHKETHWGYRLSMVSYFTLIALTVWPFGFGSAILLGWLMPLFLGFEISAALRLCVEHDWRGQTMRTVLS